jgi:hypothetical protein
MKRLGFIVGALMIVGGAVWILQGVNLLPGSFMTGDIRWAWRGLAAAGAGIVLVLILTRSSARRP